MRVKKRGAARARVEKRGAARCIEVNGGKSRGDSGETYIKKDIQGEKRKNGQKKGGFFIKKGAETRT